VAYGGFVPGVRRFAVLAAPSVGAYGAVIRPRLLRWGVTDDEVSAPHSGADLLAGARRGAKMAGTIDAPRWRGRAWLVQMGCDRAGWYSWDRLDNGGIPSAERVHPECQQIAIGDHLASTPSGKAWFEVAALERESFLVLRAPLDLRGRPFDTAGSPPRFCSDSTRQFANLKRRAERRAARDAGATDTRAPVAAAT
jgi:hypothetical protein